MDENKWEYNYSSSDNTAGDTSYPNVGSSGMNTANQYNNEPEPQAAAPDAGTYQHVFFNEKVHRVTQ